MELILVTRPECLPSKVVKDVVGTLCAEQGIQLKYHNIEDGEIYDVMDAPTLLVITAGEVRALAGFHPKDRVTAFIHNR